MGSNERRQRERDELRRKVIDAARALFVKHGYENVSMRQIAAKIEYSPTAIYLHFADKQALFLEMCTDDFAVFNRRLVAVADIDDPLGRIAAVGRAYIRFGLENPQHYRVMFMTPHPARHDPSQQREQGRGDPTRDGYALLVQAVAQAIADRKLRPELTDPDLVAQALWASVHGMVSLHIIHKDNPWLAWANLKHRIDLAIDGMIRGILARPGNFSSHGVLNARPTQKAVRK